MRFEETNYFVGFLLGIKASLRQCSGASETCAVLSSEGFFWDSSKCTGLRFSDRSGNTWSLSSSWFWCSCFARPVSSASLYSRRVHDRNRSNANILTKSRQTISTAAQRIRDWWAGAPGWARWGVYALIVGALLLPASAIGRVS